jgi:hypothetical protein
MSKQSDAKDEQCYIDAAHTCADCRNLTFTMKMPTWMVMANKKDTAAGHPTPYGDENKIKKDLRCGIGKFAVKQRGSCDLIDA